MSYAILHVDDDLLVIEKPAGLLTTPGLGPAGVENLASRVQLDFPDAQVVHRLDRDTSGIVLFARGAIAQRNLSIQFQQREVTKHYVAVAWGAMSASAGRIELPLRKDIDRPPRHCVDHALGKPAITDWRIMSRGERQTRLELAPLTGRSHQLRIHLAAIGHPIVGDNLYGDNLPGDDQHDHPPAASPAGRLMLHATSLTLLHPTSGEPITWRSAIPF